MQSGSGESGGLPVEELRDVSRRLVRELGFLRPTLGETGLGVPGAHAVLEIGRTPGILARDLAELLRLDKSNLSRQIAKLEAAGYVRRETGTDDARSFHLHLTEAGEAVRVEVDRHSDDQVSHALGKMKAADRFDLIRCLSLYVAALVEDSQATSSRRQP